MQNLAKHRLALLALAIVLAPTLTSAQTLSGQSSGTLDISFGTGGKVTTNFNGTDSARAIAVQVDGKIVVAGLAAEIGVDFALARYNRDGTLDASFGTGGRVTTDFAGGVDTALSVAIQADGKIVAAGTATINGISDFALARYNRDGTLDASFGTGGTVTTDFAGDRDQANSVVIQPETEGKIVAAGSATINGISDFALARYNLDGTLDASFGAGGTVTTDFAGGGDTAASVAVQTDGKIVAAGSATISGVDFALARYTSNGTLDATFGAGGTVTTDFAGGVDNGRSVAVQSDGKIVAAGRAVISGNSDFALARYTSNGTLDASFGTGGTVTTDFAGSVDQAFSVALQKDGNIVAAGQAIINGNSDFALARYTSNGTLDATFGTGGTVTTDVAGATDQAFSVAIQKDGKIVAAGQAIVNGGLDFALARYE
jgi:uncharacterized delta-60 repeat protein